MGVSRSTLSGMKTLCSTIRHSSAGLWFRYWVLTGSFVWHLSAFAQSGLLPSTEDDNEGSAQLAEKMRDGSVETSDIPIFILHVVEVLLKIAGGIAVIMVMVGGVQYVIGAITDNKENGKKTLMYALIGLVVSFLSWFIVDQIQQYLTASEV